MQLIKIDFHVHTHYSLDSLIDPVKLMRRSEETGVIPAITDHNTIKAHKQLRSYKGRFIPGEEIRTDKGDLIGLYLSEEIPKYTPFLEAMDSIKEQGAISYLPHMYDRTRKGVGIEELAKKVDIIETFNGHCLTNGPNQKAHDLARKTNQLSACGSDSHLLFEFGYNWNELKNFDLSDPKELIKSFKTNRQITKRAPFYVRGTLTGVYGIRKFLKMFE
ncbi:PHP domain-containing protein [Candidatus Micrarchaeota archaeon]|nr:PHP domain-containing protein [Candidatus Micrarchaeota archaeon]